VEAVMRRITIDLQDDVAEKLAETATKFNLSVDEFARQELIEIATDPKAETRRLAREIVRENAELYRRLA
jgi:hypothetical protein